MAATGSGGGQRSANGRAPGKVRVAVLFGGQSDEHDVSLRSAQTVLRALDPDRYEPIQIGISREGRWLAGDDPMRQLTARSPLFQLAPGEGAEPVLIDREPGEEVSLPASLPASLAGSVDVVFPVLHGPKGEDGTVQGLLELAGLPYVGSGVLGSAVAMDKAITKTILAQAGIPQAPWRLVTRAEWEREAAGVAERLGAELGYPCFVKPANLGSSVGISKVHGPEELAPALDLAAHYDRRLVVEAGVDARELEVSVLGNDDPVASVAGEIVPCNEFYDYDAKYVDDRSELIVPADLPPGVLARVQELAVAAFKALDLAGLARVDFLLDRGSGELYLNEVNTIPGFTSISMYPMLWEASGLPITALVDRLIELALERHGRPVATAAGARER
jgi:D-alanine-D-alanine ligase